ncbi:universal stress protein [Pseudoduganella sp. GCM10020061]|uniref:universal stress protein n=1 Tax=Pseudoduganella sp. GCM10020061 TaxID=3317345 RepID=UPI0036437B80
MFAHILFPTDGSPLSDAAMLTCMEFAKSVRARVTALHVMPEFHMLTVNTEMIEDTREQYLIDTEQRGRQVLLAVEQAAREAGVDCQTVLRRADNPYTEILEVARDQGCDLIAMASHGYRGIKAMVLGSETHKVLVHSMIPVLVLRPFAE